MARKNYQFFQPDRIAKLANLNLLARQAVEGFITGLHKSPHRGFSVEFAEHREYVAGDDLRHLDWQAWGRSDRYLLKQYEQQTNLRAHVLLDVSQSMNYKYTGEQTKFEYGAFLAGALAYLMTRQQDMVGLTLFDEAVRFEAPPASTPAHLDHLFRNLEATAPGGQTKLADTLHTLARRLAKRGLIVLISDLYDDPEAVFKALQHFVYHHHQIILFHVMDPAELSLPQRGAKQFVDLETGEQLQADPRHIRDAYQDAMEGFISQYRQYCAQQNIEYVLAPTDTPVDRMLLSYLAKRKAVRR